MEKEKLQELLNNIWRELNDSSNLKFDVVCPECEADIYEDAELENPYGSDEIIEGVRQSFPDFIIKFDGHANCFYVL